MAAKKKAAKAAAKPKPLNADKLAAADQLRAKAASEPVTVNALQLRVAALETLVSALLDAR